MKENDLEVSVIVPVYNREKYIARAVRSLLQQTLSKTMYEIIVVDDGSTDHTMQALEPFKCDIRLISGDHAGQAAAVNEGIRRARGQYIVRVDSDDYVNASFLEIERLYLLHNKEFAAVACDYVLVDSNENTIGRCDCSEKPIGCGVMFRAINLADVGLYDEKMPACEDDDLRMRYLKKFNIYRIPLPLYRYRRHSDNLTSDKEAMGIGQEMLGAKEGGDVK